MVRLRPRSPQGFTLLEMMAVVGVIGMLFTVGIASIVPTLDRMTLSAETDGVIAVIQRARALAIMQRRCVQLFIENKPAGGKQQLLIRTLNAYDCDGTTASTQAMDTAPRIVPGGPLWLDSAHVTVESKAVTVALVKGLENAEGASCPSTVTPCREIRFRPTGRLWSADADLTNDDVELKLTHAKLSEERRMTIAGNGTFSKLPAGY
jgi:prepilin-type N-terminal cleavage/methylation domain-containing protein